MNNKDSDHVRIETGVKHGHSSGERSEGGSRRGVLSWLILGIGVYVLVQYWLVPKSGIFT